MCLCETKQLRGSIAPVWGCANLPSGFAKGSSISWVAKFKGDKHSEGKLSNGWSRSYKVIKLLL